MEHGKNYAKELDKIIGRMEKAENGNAEPLPLNFRKTCHREESSFFTVAARLAAVT